VYSTRFNKKQQTAECSQENFTLLLSPLKMNLITVYILIIIFLATLVRSTFGFGESLVAVPLLLLLIPVEITVPLSVLLSVLIAAVVVVQDRKQIHFNSAKWLIIFAVLGIPIGLFILVYANENIIKSALAIIIILYSLYSILSKNNFKLKTDNKKWLFFCGFLSGILGGAYGLNGPPLVVYGKMRNWTAQHFRATLQAYFLPASIIGIVGYWFHGLLNSTVWHYFFISIPVIVPAIFLGRYLNHRLQDGTFFNYIHIGLIAIGLVLLIQSLI
jgi:uncharacterized membrane protein YfcA